MDHGGVYTLTADELAQAVRRTANESVTSLTATATTSLPPPSSSVSHFVNGLVAVCGHLVHLDWDSADIAARQWWSDFPTEWMHLAIAGMHYYAKQPVEPLEPLERVVADASDMLRVYASTCQMRIGIRDAYRAFVVAMPADLVVDTDIDIDLAETDPVAAFARVARILATAASRNDYSRELAVRASRWEHEVRHAVPRVLERLHATRSQFIHSVRRAMVAASSLPKAVTTRWLRDAQCSMWSVWRSVPVR